jgi:hypothetical protein
MDLERNESLGKIKAAKMAEGVNRITFVASWSTLPCRLEVVNGSLKDLGFFIFKTKRLPLLGINP